MPRCAICWATLQLNGSHVPLWDSPSFPSDAASCACVERIRGTATSKPTHAEPMLHSLGDQNRGSAFSRREWGLQILGATATSVLSNTAETKNLSKAEQYNSPSTKRLPCRCHCDHRNTPNNLPERTFSLTIRRQPRDWPVPDPSCSHCQAMGCAERVPSPRNINTISPLDKVARMAAQERAIRRKASRDTRNIRFPARSSSISYIATQKVARKATRPSTLHEDNKPRDIQESTEDIVIGVDIAEVSLPPIHHSARLMSSSSVMVMESPPSSKARAMGPTLSNSPTIPAMSPVRSKLSQWPFLPYFRKRKKSGFGHVVSKTLGTEIRPLRVMSKLLLLEMKHTCRLAWGLEVSLYLTVSDL